MNDPLTHRWSTIVERNASPSSYYVTLKQSVSGTFFFKISPLFCANDANDALM